MSTCAKPSSSMLCVGAAHARPDGAYSRSAAYSRPPSGALSSVARTYHWFSILQPHPEEPAPDPVTQ
jgi:hypothetical protein